MSNQVQGESFSKLRKGYKPVLVTRKYLLCEYGCMGWFRSEWDLQQHIIYAHEVEGNVTTRRVINEAVRNIGRTSTHDTYSISFTPKKEGDWTFVPRGAKSVRPNTEQLSTKTGNSVWQSEFSRVLSLNKKSDQPSASRSVRTKNISNPIPQHSSIEATERIGTDVAIRPRNPAELTARGTSHVAHSSGSSGICRPPNDNPIALEDRDFDSASDSDFSAPSSPSQISTPLDVRASLGTHGYQKRYASPPHSSAFPPIQTDLPRPSPAPRSLHGSFSRPTLTAYPLLLRQYMDKQPHSLTSHNSPRSPTVSGPPIRPPRPPIPIRNPARPLRTLASSKDGHSFPTSYNHPVSVGSWLRRSPSHGALRI